MSLRPKVLICAYACSPYRGSEPGVGWGFVYELAKSCELWVIVEEEKFRAEIERYLLEDASLKEFVHFYFLRKKRNRLLRRIWPPSYYWYYRRWHQDAFVLAKTLDREVGFDIVHQLTMVGFREPGYLWKLNRRFVWGPVGGMGLFPWRFLTTVGVYGFFYYLGYNLYNWFEMRFLVRPNMAAQSAGVGLITATPENQAGAQKFWGVASDVISEVGIPEIKTKAIVGRKPGDPLRIVWVGQHTRGKALNLGLKALALVPNRVNWELSVVGKGVLFEHWQHKAAALGVGGRCHFMGWLPREEVMEIMTSSHVMLITSLRDLTSTVTVEALANALPVVCLDHCGFGWVVNSSCGIKVMVSTPAKVIAGLAKAIEALAEDEALRLGLAKGAAERARDFLWRRKAAVVKKIYEEKLRETLSGRD